MTDLQQATIDTLLAQLKDLRQQIAAAKTVIAPLENDLSQVYLEFQAAVGGLRRQTARFQSEIDTLREQIDSFGQDLEDDASFGDDAFPAFDLSSDLDVEADSEAVEKDVLLEHLFQLLDPMTNEDDSELVATLQGLCQDPLVSLADVLQTLPWGAVWTQRGRQEALADQHRRLTGWAKALVQQLEVLQKRAEGLQQDPRQGLLQQFTKGPEVWQAFLAQYAEQQRDQNAELRAELENLRQEWTRMTEGSESKRLRST